MSCYNLCWQFLFYRIVSFVSFHQILSCTHASWGIFPKSINGNSRMVKSFLSTKCGMESITHFQTSSKFWNGYNISNHPFYACNFLYTIRCLIGHWVLWMEFYLITLKSDFRQNWILHIGWTTNEATLAIHPPNIRVVFSCVISMCYPWNTNVMPGVYARNENVHNENYIAFLIALIPSYCFVVFFLNSLDTGRCESTLKSMYFSNADQC